jgi:hypothetical protein
VRSIILSLIVEYERTLVAVLQKTIQSIPSRIDEVDPMDSILILFLVITVLVLIVEYISHTGKTTLILPCESDVNRLYVLSYPDGSHLVLYVAKSGDKGEIQRKALMEALRKSRILTKHRGVNDQPVSVHRSASYSLINVVDDVETLAKRTVREPFPYSIVTGMAGTYVYVNYLVLKCLNACIDNDEKAAAAYIGNSGCLASKASITDYYNYLNVCDVDGVVPHSEII